MSGDMKSTWRMAQSLLHTGRKTVYDDADSKKLATTFSQFFSEKISQIRAKIATALHINRSSFPSQTARRVTELGIGPLHFLHTVL